MVSTAGDGVIAVGSEGKKGVQVGGPLLDTKPGLGVPVGVDTGKLQLHTLIRSKLSVLKTNQYFLSPSKMSMWEQIIPKNL